MERNMKRVYIIVGRGYTTEKARDEIVKEGYKFEFCFATDREALLDADEIWIFGDCNHVEEYQIAVGFGKDIWVMG